VADSVYSNDWNYGNKADAGNFGFGFQSPIWDILGNPDVKKFDVYLTNFNKWSEVNTTYTPTTTQSKINLGGYSTDYDASTDLNFIVSPTTSGGQLMPLTSFGFGQTYDNNTASYYSLLNSGSDYGIYENTTLLSLNFRGLGLP
jgi:hypothetical protein